MNDPSPLSAPKQKAVELDQELGRRGWRTYFGFSETPEGLIGLTPLGPTAIAGCSMASMENSTLVGGRYPFSAISFKID